MQRVGIYPGTFDPVHEGHIAFALESISVCDLDRVIFLPEHTPRYKVNVTPLEVRIQQVEMMIRSHSQLSVQRLQSSQFSVKTTLPEIRQHLEGAQPTLLVGSDVALSLNRWDDLNVLLKEYDITIGIRSLQTENEMKNIIAKLSINNSAKFIIVHTSYPAVTSSTLRKSR